MTLHKHKLAIAEAWISIFANILLFVLKYWAGFVTGSIAIMADAWHTLSDSFSSIIVLIGAKISAKPADDNHPFGHGRAELISSFIIGMMLAMVGISFLQKAVVELRGGEGVEYGKIAIIVTLVSIIVKELLAQFAFWAARREHSTALRGDAWHHRSDAISSVLILMGIFLGKYFWWIDGALAIVVALLIFYATFQVLSDTIHQIIGTKPKDNLLDDIRGICEHHTVNPFSVHHMHVHEYGAHKEVTFHIRLADKMTIERAYQITRNIKNQIRDELKIEATINIEPMRDVEKLYVD